MHPKSAANGQKANSDRLPLTVGNKLGCRGSRGVILLYALESVIWLEGWLVGRFRQMLLVGREVGCRWCCGGCCCCCGLSLSLLPLLVLPSVLAAAQ